MTLLAALAALALAALIVIACALGQGSAVLINSERSIELHKPEPPASAASAPRKAAP